MPIKVTNGQLAVAFANILGKPFSGEIDDQGAFERFCTDAAQLLADYCGGEVVTPAQYAPEPGNMDWASHYVLEIQPNEPSASDGGLWTRLQSTT